MAKKLAQRLADPVTVTLQRGDWDVIHGLLTIEWQQVRNDPNRSAYTATLERMRREISRRAE
jgi:hypothetical protein